MKHLPRIPRHFEAPAGRVRVRLVKHPRDYDDHKHRPRKTPCWGTYSASRRLVEIDRRAPRWFQWHTYYHEWAHAALIDGGVAQVLRSRKHEAVCDAFASARMRERFG